MLTEIECSSLDLPGLDWDGVQYGGQFRSGIILFSIIGQMCVQKWCELAS